MSQSLKDKVVAITGASSGIGEATATALASKGARVVLFARRSDRLEAIVKRLSQEKNGSSIAFAVSGDVTSSQDVEALVQAVVKAHGRLDAIICNAGIMPTSRLDELKLEDWNAMIDVNIRGVTNTIAAALPIFQKQKYGHFITVASTSGIKVVPTQSIYAGTKHAVRAIMDGLRQEMVPDIRSTIITPGATKTEGFDALGAQSEEAAKRMEQYSKMAMDPSAVANCIVFAMEQPANVNIGEIVVRSSAQP